MCPRRLNGGLVETDVKSQAGRRGIVLPDQLYALLEEHREAQSIERLHAGTVWEDGDWMFTQPNGRPISPEQDGREWKELLAAADVRPARLHDARAVIFIQPKPLVSVVARGGVEPPTYRFSGPRLSVPDRSSTVFTEVTATLGTCDTR